MQKSHKTHLRGQTDVSFWWLTDNVLFLLMIKEIKKVGKDLGITPTIIRDEELKERGFGGISCW